MEPCFSDLNREQKSAFLRVFINTLQHKKADRYQAMFTEALSYDIVRAVVNFRLLIDEPEQLPVPNTGELWILEEITMSDCDFGDTVEFKCVCPDMMRIELCLKDGNHQYFYAKPTALAAFAKEQDLDEEFDEACRFSLSEFADERVLTELHEDLCFDWNEDLEAL